MANIQGLQMKSLTAGQSLTVLNARFIQIHTKSLLILVVQTGTQSVFQPANSIWEFKANEGNIFLELSILVTTGITGVIWY